HTHTPTNEDKREHTKHTPDSLPHRGGWMIEKPHTIILQTQHRCASSKQHAQQGGGRECKNKGKDIDTWGAYTPAVALAHALHTQHVHTREVHSQVEYIQTKP